MAGKADIVKQVAQSVDGLTNAQAAQAFDQVFETIRINLEKGEKVTIPGFGTFSLSERAARQGRNPATGASITIPAQKGVKFKPGKDLKDALNG